MGKPALFFYALAAPGRAKSRRRLALLSLSRKSRAKGLAKSRAKGCKENVRKKAGGIIDKITKLC